MHRTGTWHALLQGFNGGASVVKNLEQKIQLGDGENLTDGRTEIAECQHTFVCLDILVEHDESIQHGAGQELDIAQIKQECPAFVLIDQRLQFPANFLDHHRIHHPVRVEIDNLDISDLFGRNLSKGSHGNLIIRNEGKPILIGIFFSEKNRNHAYWHFLSADRATPSPDHHLFVPTDQETLENQDSADRHQATTKPIGWLNGFSAGDDGSIFQEGAVRFFHLGPFFESLVVKSGCFFGKHKTVEIVELEPKKEEHRSPDKETVLVEIHDDFEERG